MHRLIARTLIIYLTITVFIPAASPGQETKQATGVPYAKASDFKETPLTLKVEKFKLPAMLTMPTNDEAAVSGVVLVHGSGPQDMDETQGENKVFRDLAWGLAAHGVATLRYEKRTRKYGARVSPEIIDLEWETIDDALAAARLLRKQEGIDPRRVFVLGHSLGGMAAPLIASRDNKLAGIIVMAGNARPLVDLIEDQLTYLAGLGGAEGKKAQQLLDQSRSAIKAIQAGKPEEAKQPLLGAPNAYWADLSRRDSLSAAQQLEMPILILQGKRDYLVTMKDYELWKARLSEKDSVAFKLYDQLNHGMIPCRGTPGPADDIAPGHVDVAVIRDIADWIGATRPFGAPATSEK